MNSEKEIRTGFRVLDVITVSVAHFVHDVYSSFLSPILPLLIEKLGISYSLAGFLTVVQRAPSLLNPFIGLIADKIAVRYLVILSPAVTATAMSLLGLAPSYGLIVIILIVTGVSAAMFHVPAPVMVKRISGEKIGKGMGFFMFGGEIARSAAPVYVLAAVSWWGLEGIYKLIPIGWAATFLLFLRLRKIKIKDEFSSKAKETGAGKTFRNHLPLFVSVLGISFTGALVRSALTAFLPTYIKDAGESLLLGGIALSTLQLTGAAGTFIAGYFSDKIGRRNTLMIIAGVSPLLLVAFTFTSGIGWFVVLVLLGLFIFAIPPVLMAEVNSTETEHPAFMNGIYMTLNFSAGGIAVVLVGLIADVLGLQITYRICAVMSLASFYFIRNITNKK